MTLTEEQKKLVEDNHNLIYFVLRRFNWNIDEYYDMAAYALCRAALLYKPDKNIRFSSYAVKSIFNTIWNYRLREAKHYIDGTLLSLDQEFQLKTNDDTGCLLDLISDCGSQIEDCYKSLYLEELVEKLKPRDREILNLRLDGYTHKEIAKSFVCVDRP